MAVGDESQSAQADAAQRDAERKMALSRKIRAMGSGWSGNSAELIRESRDSSDDGRLR